jgi:hypothetical protein
MARFFSLQYPDPAPDSCWDDAMQTYFPRLPVRGAVGTWDCNFHADSDVASNEMRSCLRHEI